MTRVFAAADIGSNTAHLLIAASDGRLVTRVDNINEWIPLGETVAREGFIPKDRADELVMAMKEFRRMAQAEAGGRLYVFGTEAMRSAKNGEDVIRRVEKDAGVRVDVITPRREAELAYRGVLLDASGLDLGAMIELGGGSAQVGSVVAGELADEVSLPLGTGRVIAEAGLSNPCPPERRAAAEAYIAKELKRSTITPTRSSVAASGGVARGLWRALHPDGEKALSGPELEYMIWAASRLSEARLVSRFNVKPKRAGTLLPGAMVYLALMNQFGLERMAVSEFGVREGAILEMANGLLEAGSK